MELLEVIDYGPKTNIGHRYFLVVFDDFSRLGWKNPLENKNAQTAKESSENIPCSSKKKTKIVETELGKNLCTKVLPISLRRSI